MKSVPHKECKGWSNAKMLLHRENKTRRDKTTTELLSSRMFKELKNKDWDMTRAQRRGRLIREERDFFLDFVLALI